MSCLACDLVSGRAPLPGGRLYETSRWVVEHCVGPLGLGSLIAKPARHVISVGDLDDDESAELGPLLRRTAQVARALVDAEQVYVCQMEMFRQNRTPDTAEIERIAERARALFAL
jgi:diadenosine tetraphosphate (Ap4A) HIT family hydrolase